MANVHHIKDPSSEKLDPKTAEAWLSEIQEKLSGLTDILETLQSYAEAAPANPLRGALSGLAKYSEELWGTCGCLNGGLESDLHDTDYDIEDFDCEVSNFVDLIGVLVEEALNPGGKGDTNPLLSPLHSAHYYAERISKSLRKLAEGWPASVETAA